MAVPNGDQTRPRGGRFFLNWWLVPLVTVCVVLGLAMIDLVLLGLAVMATDECSSDAPCPQGDEIEHVKNFWMTATPTGLLLLTLALAWRSVRWLRLVVAVLTVLCAAWPALWIVSGNPKPSP